MKNASFLFLLCSLAFTACDSPPDDTVKKPATDTTSVPKPITMSDSALNKSEFEKEEFQQFLKEYKSKPLVYIHDTMEDVTGDGTKQRVHVDIHSSRDTFIVHHQVWRGKEMLWSDTVKLDPGYCIFILGDDSANVIRYKPWSYFYFAMQCRKFIQEYVIPADPVFAIFQGSRADSLYWSGEVKKYKGKILIGESGTMDPDSYIWDKRCNQFILYYSP
jgi:hypothetical protein